MIGADELSTRVAVIVEGVRTHRLSYGLSALHPTSKQTKSVITPAIMPAMAKDFDCRRSAMRPKMMASGPKSHETKPMNGTNDNTKPMRPMINAAFPSAL